MNWGKLCSWNNHLKIFCFLFRITLFLVIHFISLLCTTFSGTYVRTVRQVSYAPASEFGNRKSEDSSSAFVCSRLRESSVRWIEKARAWKKIKQNKTKTKQNKKIGRKLGRGRALPFSFFLPPPPPTFCVPFTLASPTLLHVFPTISTIWEPETG